MAKTFPSILFQSEDGNVVLIDVPKSIEEAQVLPLKAKSDTDVLKRLISVKPLEKPFKTPEPRNAIGFPSESVSDLIALGAATSALNVLQNSYTESWLLPRVVPEDERCQDGSQKRKRRATVNDSATRETGDLDAQSSLLPMIPEGSRFLHGTISAERKRFLEEAPVFDLIVLDPPWPNRSARRKKRNYTVADSLSEIRETLSSIPITAHLAPDGLVAVWITNRTSVVDLLTGPRGLFHEWGLELVGDWTWLKVTTSGEPILDLNSKWRKPWERILIVRRRGGHQKLDCGSKVIVSVPDVHSRKPNLRGLFEAVLPTGYRGLEVFARNLTAGWWAWGDEVLKFQRPENWVDP